MKTTGEVFPNGVIVDLLAFSSTGKQNLLVSDGTTRKIAPRIKFGGHTYEASAIDPSILKAMRLPAGCASYTSTAQLLGEITQLFMGQIDLPQPDSGLLAYFSLSTWFIDALPSAPGLSIVGPDVHRALALLNLLSCVCRRPLKLAELTPGCFRALPLHLNPTLLIHQPWMTRRVATFLDTSAHRGILVPGKRGEILDIYGARAVYLGTDSTEIWANSGAIQMSLPPSRSCLPILDEICLSEIAGQLQPKLLMYRLENWQKVHKSVFDVPKFTFPTRTLARNLGACVVDDKEALEQLTSLLQSQDGNFRLQRRTDVSYCLLEVILGLLHSKKLKRVRVEELANLTNALLRNNGEFLEFSPKEIGWRLRDFGLTRHRDSAGKFFALGRDESLRVHSLAHSHGSGSVRQDCPECAAISGD
jgi:hypothetical protein